MQLTDEQNAKVREWITAGAKLSEIQDRLSKEFDLHPLYMDVRMLVDDLKLVPKETNPEPVKPPAPEAPAAPEDFGTGEPLSPDVPFEDPLAAAPPLSGNVTVTVDQITRPGAAVSGHATFSDGKKSEWYLDQYGRFGLVPPEPDYRPSEADLAEFQVILDRELRKLGY